VLFLSCRWAIHFHAKNLSIRPQIRHLNPSFTCFPAVFLVIDPFFHLPFFAIYFPIEKALAYKLLAQLVNYSCLCLLIWSLCANPCTGRLIHVSFPLTCFVTCSYCILPWHGISCVLTLSDISSSPFFCSLFGRSLYCCLRLHKMTSLVHPR
jgi:hypothetical protein